MSFRSVMDCFWQRCAVRRIERSGGVVGYTHEWDDDRDCFSKQEAPGPRYLRLILGSNYFATVRLVIFSEVFVSRHQLEDLVCLNHMDKLGIVDCTMAKGAINVLSGISRLSHLSLCGTKIDESEMLELGRLRNLKSLVLSGTGISSDNLAQLQSLLPTCEIRCEPVRLKNLIRGENVKLGQARFVPAMRMEARSWPRQVGNVSLKRAAFDAYRTWRAEVAQKNF